MQILLLFDPQMKTALYCSDDSQCFCFDIIINCQIETSIQAFNLEQLDFQLPSMTIAIGKTDSQVTIVHQFDVHEF